GEQQCPPTDSRRSERGHRAAPTARSGIGAKGQEGGTSNIRALHSTLSPARPPTMRNAPPGSDGDRWLHVRARRARRLARALPRGPRPHRLRGSHTLAGSSGPRQQGEIIMKRPWIGPGNWQFFNYSSCAVGPDGAAYGGNVGFVTAVERDGRQRWQTNLDASWIHRPPALSPDGKRLYVGGDGLGLAALDTA